MATIIPEVRTSYRRSDGTFQVRLRITHKGDKTYIPTSYYAADKQLKKSKGKITGHLRDQDLIERLNDIVKEYRQAIVKLGSRLSRFSVQELASYLEDEQYKDAVIDVDFIAFGWNHEKKVRKTNEKYADSFKNTLNSLQDFFRRTTVDVKEITPNMLTDYEDYLKTERKMIRKSRSGDEVTIVSEPMKQSGIAVYMTNIRTMFNEARRRHNNQVTGEIKIPHQPFEIFRIKKGPAAKKRSLDADIIRSIRDLEDFVYMGTHGTNLAAFGRDVFMLSFYLVGMNPIDLYSADTIKDGRIEYNRQKTAGRRSDEAFISIKIEPEAAPLLERYRDQSGQRIFDFHGRYTNSNGFLRALNDGLKKVSDYLSLPEKVTMYYARHSWSTIARNKCGISREDVHEALNHVDQELKITDLYIEKDWSHIDRANRKVLDYLSQS